MTADSCVLVHLAAPAACWEVQRTDLYLCAIQKGAAELPRLTLKGSCEAIMKGRKPPFRLLACAVGSDGRPANIQPAVSDGFVVSSATTCIQPASKTSSSKRQWSRSQPGFPDSRCLDPEKQRTSSVLAG